MRSTATGNKKMYDYLIHMGADRTMMAHGLSPLKLSVYLGKCNMFEHIMRSRMVNQWIWGPIRARNDSNSCVLTTMQQLARECIRCLWHRR